MSANHPKTPGEPCAPLLKLPPESVSEELLTLKEREPQEITFRLPLHVRARNAGIAAYCRYMVTAEELPTRPSTTAGPGVDKGLPVVPAPYNESEEGKGAFIQGAAEGLYAQAIDAVLRYVEMRYAMPYELDQDLKQRAMDDRPVLDLPTMAQLYPHRDYYATEHRLPDRSERFNLKRYREHPEGTDEEKARQIERGTRWAEALAQHDALENEHFVQLSWWRGIGEGFRRRTAIEEQIKRGGASRGDGPKQVDVEPPKETP